ncbi:Eukaryotic translation initiation factor 4B [Orchesella cincta]|uniref:Eukaryotic translation initiation factor 4B n=1 Tax=Orchesella cincta TaxID=48709 RepID=A0A1D2MN09_ORCCI|nr:Eukaryotic translation initiation factor 4B [Orchesella cincta]
MSSKKNKKSKGVTMSLQDFAMRVEEGTGAPTPGTGQNVVYAEKKPKMPVMSSWADEVEEDGSFFEKERIILPSAPRAARGPAYADHEIPSNPPFTAHLGNLPYDINDEEIYKFFRDLEIADLKLPRDQQTNRLRGFGYVDFHAREDLIEALIRNEQMLRGRPIRITLGTGQRGGPDMDRSGMRGGEDRRRPRGPPPEDEDIDDWRSMMKPQGFDEAPSQEFRRGPPSGDYGSMPRREGGGYGNRERRDYGPPRDRPEEIEFSRDQMMAPPPPSSREGGGGYDSYGGGRGGGSRGGGGGYQSRGGDRDRDYYGGRGGGEGGGGRRDYNRGGDEPYYREEVVVVEAEDPLIITLHPAIIPSRVRTELVVGVDPNNKMYLSLAKALRKITRRRQSPDNYSGHRSDEEDDGGSVSPQGPSEERREREREQPKERKRLVLQPRTVDKPPGESEPQANASIFGGAKPVDTQKREREIEEKLEKLKVEEPPKEEGQQEEEQGSGSDGGGASSHSRETRTTPPRERREPRGGDSSMGSERGSDRDRPRQFRLLTRNNSGNNGKDAYVDVEAPYESVKGSSASGSSSRSHLNSRPPPSSSQGYNPRFMRSDDKDRERGGDRGTYSRGGRGGSREMTRRDMEGGPGRRDFGDGGSRGGRGDFRRMEGGGGPGSRDQDGGRGGGGGRYNDGGPRRGGYSDRRDDEPGLRGGGGVSGGYRDVRDDFRRGPPSSSHHGHHPNNNQSSSVGSQEERDRDSHSEPEDDRDMIREVAAAVVEEETKEENFQMTLQILQE